MDLPSGRATCLVVVQPGGHWHPGHVEDTKNTAPQKNSPTVAAYKTGMIFDMVRTLLVMQNTFQIKKRANKRYRTLATFSYKARGCLLRARVLQAFNLTPPRHPFNLAIYPLAGRIHA